MTAYHSVSLWIACTVAGIASVAVAATSATPALAQSRGELLYSTHCGGCHTAQLHWRAGKVVTDWRSLRAEVHKWQDEARLGWSEDDVVDVARYLNESMYHFVIPRAAVETTFTSEAAASSPRTDLRR